ncbi:hypothetical protein HJC23_008252 [Cyclotella cryptica]|uniref:NADP-dependent oxidoreductase domain-containing protein n=1 Tax=Cyclotella cryptica TaxID=29204 RepID=A0ABD3QCA4_9STRA|eukprot:CCRYP_008398-RA/>CCRYP_008398-RA protein AED:0.42 eAED:0.42 QI:0/-1/0/1/-1/1/1/0/373
MFKFFLARIVPLLVLAMAIILGWLASYESPLAVFFATFIPLSKGHLPPTLFGHGKMKGTPPVPDEMIPQSRPENEKFLHLPGGYSMPQIGIGMCCRPTAYDDELVYRTILWYLLLGGRHIDGAHLYMNHVAIGRGIAEAIRRGVKREEIFVTTKIFPSHFGYESTMKNVEVYAKELGLDYIDLVLMHAPTTFPFMTSPCKKEGKDATQCRRETWKALSELRASGLIRNAGVSNFAMKHLKDLEGIGAPIANNQIQFTPFEPEHVMETVAYCAEHNITMTAYSPLGGIMDQDKAMADEVLNQIAAKYDKRVSHVMLRWATQRGFAVIPGTGNPDHMRENLSIFGFELSDDDMQTINELKYRAKGFVHIDVRNSE